MTGHPSPDNAVLNVRTASPADAERVAELSRELGYEATADQMRGRLQRLEHDPDRAVFVACTPDGTVAGWIDVHITSHLQSGASAAIGGLIVGEGLRSRGVGRLLVARAEAWARAKGMTHIRVRSNAPTHTASTNAKTTFAARLPPSSTRISSADVASDVAGKRYTSCTDSRSELGFGLH